MAMCAKMDRKNPRRGSHSTYHLSPEVSYEDNIGLGFRFRALLTEQDNVLLLTKSRTTSYSIPRTIASSWHSFHLHLGRIQQTPLNMCLLQ